MSVPCRPQQETRGFQNSRRFPADHRNLVVRVVPHCTHDSAPPLGYTHPYKNTPGGIFFASFVHGHFITGGTLNTFPSEVRLNTSNSKVVHRYLMLPRLKRGRLFSGFTPLTSTGTLCPWLKPRRYRQQLPNRQPLLLPQAAR